MLNKDSQSSNSRDAVASENHPVDLNQGFYLGDWLAEPLKGTIARDKDTIHLEPKVMDVLICLAGAPSDVVLREDLFDQVWGNVVVSEEVLTRCISELRSALGDTSNPRCYIQTLPKRGYRLLKPVQAVIQAPLQPQNPHADDDQAAQLHWFVPVAIALGLALLIPVGMALRTSEPITAVPAAADDNALSLNQTPNEAAQPGEIIQTIAVLPFVNLSGGEDSDYFANGLTADIRNTLMRLSSNELRVVARTSSEVFRGQALDIRRIGRQLDAGLIVEGTVRINNDRVRVTAQLTNAVDGFPIWAERFEHDLEDGLLIQSDIAERIAEQLVPSTPTDRTETTRQANLKAYDYYLLGRHHWNRRTPEALNLADNYFRQALELDPDYALALSGLADSLILKEEYGGDNPIDAVDLAQQLTQRALDLAPELAEAHASVGAIASHKGDSVTAEQAYRKAVGLKPSYSMGRMWLGNLLLRKNAVNEAFEHFSSALKVDPLNPIVQQNHLRALSLMGRYDEASKRVDSYLTESRPDNLLKTWMYTMLHAGKYDELLGFAVRHTFSDEYADYGSQIVMEALIYLQRFDEAKKLYEQLAQTLSGAKRSWYLATLGTALRDHEKLLLAAELMASDSTRENPYYECQNTFVNYWRGLAAHIQGDFAAAAILTGNALNQDTASCMGEPVNKAEILAYQIDSLNRSGNGDQALALAREAIDELQFIIQQGRRGLDIEFAEFAINVAAQKMDRAHTQLDTMQDNNWQYYAKLAHMPLFDGHYDQLHKDLGRNAQQFAMMQSACKDIGMTKFGL